MRAVWSSQKITECVDLSYASAKALDLNGEQARGSGRATEVMCPE